jgi:hypothetical protein
LRQLVSGAGFWEGFLGGEHWGWPAKRWIRPEKLARKPFLLTFLVPRESADTRNQ